MEDTETHAELYEHLHKWLGIVVDGLRPASAEFINHYGSMNMKDAAKQNDELMARAQSVGASLA